MYLEGKIAIWYLVLEMEPLNFHSSTKGKGLDTMFEYEKETDIGWMWCSVEPNQIHYQQHTCVIYKLIKLALFNVKIHTQLYESGKF